MVLSLHSVNRIEEIVARTQAESRAPSMVAAIVRDGSIAHVTGAGETPVPDRDVQFRIGSISKTLTAAVLLGLRDAGELSLDARVGDFIPALPDTLATVRLRYLLGQAGGLQREPEGPWWERSAGGSLADLVSALTAAKIAFPPSSRFHYSNLGYGLLGAVVEAVTGQSWLEAVTARLLRPLGMRRTTYHPQEPFARGYVVHPLHQTLREEPRHDAGAMAAAGQLWSTAADLSRWAAVIANSGLPAAQQSGAVQPGALLSPDTLAEMASPVVMVDPDCWTAAYGLGLHLWRRGDRVFVGHTGSMPGYLAVIAIHRPSRTGVVAFANTYSLPGTSIGALGTSLLEAVLDSEPVPARPTWRPSVPPPDAAESLCGRWWWMGRAHDVAWDQRAGQLVVVPPREDEDPWTFVPIGEDVWRGVGGDNAGELLRVRRTPAGEVEALDIATYLLHRDIDADD